MELFEYNLTVTKVSKYETNINIRYIVTGKIN